MRALVSRWFAERNGEAGRSRRRHLRHRLLELGVLPRGQLTERRARQLPASTPVTGVHSSYR